MKYLSWNLTVLSGTLALAISGNCAAVGPSAGSPVAANAASAASKSNVEASKASDESMTSQGAMAQPQGKTKAVAAVSPCPPPAVLPAGSYMGIQVGYDYYRMRDGLGVAFGGNAVNANYAANPEGWAFGALLGYGLQLSRLFYLGGEIYINANTLNQTYTYNTPAAYYTYNLDSGPTYGISLLPGIKLTPTTLTFLRLGWSRTMFKTQESFSGLVNSSEDRLASGFTFGVGFETLMIYTYSLRAEYQHAIYQSYNTNTPYGTRVTPSANQFLVSLIYHAV